MQPKAAPTTGSMTTLATLSGPSFYNSFSISLLFTLEEVCIASVASLLAVGVTGRDL